MPKAEESDRPFMIWLEEGVSSELPVCSHLLHCGETMGVEVSTCANPKFPTSSSTSMATLNMGPGGSVRT